MRLKKIMFLALLVSIFLVPSIGAAWTANVTFDVDENPLYRTVVLVSETSGDYSESYGRISEPGAATLSIDGIKPSTQYYFVAYRLTDMNVSSGYSEECPVLSPARIEPTVHELPPIPVAGVVLNIAISVE